MIYGLWFIVSLFRIFIAILHFSAIIVRYQFFIDAPQKGTKNHKPKTINKIGIGNKSCITTKTPFAHSS